MRQSVYGHTPFSFMICYAMALCCFILPSEHKNDLAVNMIQACPCVECEPCCANLWRRRQHPFTDQEKNVAQAFLNLPIGIASHKGLPLVDIVLRYDGILPTELSLSTLDASGLVSYKETSFGYCEDVKITDASCVEHNHIALQDTKFKYEDIQRLLQTMSDNKKTSFEFMSLCEKFSYICESHRFRVGEYCPSILKRKFFLDVAPRITACIEKIQENEKNKQKKPWWQFYGVLC